MSDDVYALAQADRDAVFKTLTLAFAGDPATRFLYPEPERYLKYQADSLELFGGKAFDEGTAYAIDDMGGVALWLPPGVQADGEVLADYMKKTTHPDRVDEAFGALGVMDDYHPKEPHWYLAVLGVDPSRQGGGLGGKLLTHMLARVDEERLPAYLESSNPRNVSLYLRFGFEPQGTIELGGKPIMTPMLRPARV
ncbi:MAG: GNAT family N-acetyltransferase [Alphaproteobacteria bacterium]